MEITTLQIVLIFIVACIAGMGSVLDEFQFHRPLVACTLIGFILGDMKTGIIIGGTLEMIAPGWMNIGAAVAPDAAPASIISTILVIAGGQSVGAGIASPFRWRRPAVLTIIVRTLTVAFQHAADSAAERGSLRAITGSISAPCCCRRCVSPFRRSSSPSRLAPPGYTPCSTRSRKWSPAA